MDDERELNAAGIYAACVCLGLQRAARGVARRYDEALRPIGLTSGQFSILSALLRDDPIPMGSLADLLGLDRTTLKRNLGPLERGNLIAIMPDQTDARVRRIQLTEAGRARVEAAIPLWRSAQAASNGRLGDEGWSDLKPLLARLSK